MNKISEIVQNGMILGIPLKIFLFVLAVILCVSVTMVLTGKKYQIKTYKLLIMSLCLSIIAYESSALMAMIENGIGLSLFGGLLFSPIFMIPIGLLLRVKLTDMWDLCAPAGALALSAAKINCFVNGCCSGRFLYYAGPDKYPVYFPSQIVECLNTLILFAILIRFVNREKHRGVLYPWAMIYYGITRFGLTFLRGRREAFVWILPNGAFWSLVTLAIAVPLMILYKRRYGIKGSREQTAKD